MEPQCCLSRNAKEYESTFRNILMTMMREMTGAQVTNSISHNFIVRMIPHHRAAIEMSKNILRTTTFVPVQEIAEGIVTEQEKSIAQMQQALGPCSRAENAPGELRMYQALDQRIFRTMFLGMKQPCVTNQLNAVFMQQMLPHHRGAVEFSENTLRCRICPELVPVLNAIISSQKQGIRRMQELLWAMGY